MTAYLHDSFDRPDGDLGGSVAPTGQTWTMTGEGATPGSAVISSGRVIQATSPCYPNVDLGGSPSLMSAICSWTDDDQSGGGNTGPVLISSIGGDRNPGGGAWANMVHPAFSNAGYLLTVYVDNVASDTLAWHPYTVVPDGRPYLVQVEYSGDTITATCPDGAVVEVTDSRIGTVRGRHLIFQIYELPDNIHTRLDEVTAEGLPSVLLAGLATESGVPLALEPS